MKKQLPRTGIFLLLLLTSHSICAQWDDGLWVGKQANNWIFYEEIGLNFDISPPTINPNAVTTQYANNGDQEGTGVGTISDTNGNLLFSVSLDSIWNKNYQFMNNGDGILTDPGASGMQVGLTIPVPGPSNEYYIFSKNRAGNLSYGGSDVAGIGDINTLVYSVVNMDLDNGLGEVTAKNIILDAPMEGKITAVYHANGEDIWVIGHGGASVAPDPADQQYDSFYAYLVTENGISSPVMSTIGIPLDVSYGQLKASPDGSKIAYVNGIAVLAGATVNLEVFDFNNATGVVSNPIDLSNGMGALAGWGLEFSPNSRYLYVTEPGYSLDFSRLHQFDLEAGGQSAILASDVLIGEVTPAAFNSLQLAPDGKIYMANKTSYYSDPNATGHLSVIQYPNNKGMAAQFDHLSFDLQGPNCDSGLPSFIQSYFESGILHEGDCVGREVTFSTLRIPGIESVTWDFDDPNGGPDNILTTPDGTASHVFLDPGTYTITAEITSNGAVQFATTEITINQIDLLSAEFSLQGCPPFDLTTSTTEVDPDIVLGYYNAEEDALNETNAIANAENYTFPGNEKEVFIRAENAEGCTDLAKIHLVRKDCAIPQGISPNGDQWNQNFDLSYMNIQSLEIFNRYGRSVFNKESYTNEWFGQTDNGDELPTGTYFYVIKLEEGYTFQGKSTLTGWVYVNREVN